MSTELREKLDSYESILTEMMQSSRKVGVVKSNPYRDTANGLTLVRVSVGDGDQIAIIPGDILKGQTLEPGMPVQMIDGKVVGIIPDELDVKKEVPTYKLASWDDIGGLKEQIQRIRDANRTSSEKSRVVHRHGYGAHQGSSPIRRSGQR